jgi:hypothetical protein
MQNQLIIANQHHEIQRAELVVPVALPDGIVLPLKSLEQLLHLNTCCQDADIRANLVSLSLSLIIYCIYLRSILIKMKQFGTRMYWT